jgi:F-type H+-transporting ATPase subunit a
MKLDLFEYEKINLLKFFGVTHPFWNVHYYTIFYTWVAMAALFSVTILVTYLIKKDPKNSFIFAIETITKFFMDLCSESIGFFRYDFFAFVSSLFLFTFFCNIAGILPFIKEPTEDINTALALGICSFIYVQTQKIKIEGTWAFFKEFLFIPSMKITKISDFFITLLKVVFIFIPANIILIPINIVGEIAKAVSMAFRLFGNILGGSIILTLIFGIFDQYQKHFLFYIGSAFTLFFIIKKAGLLDYKIFKKFIIPINSGLIFSLAWLIIFFGLFEGAIQAFVITMLTITYLSLIEPAETTKETALEGAQ